MRRREFITLFGGTVATWPLAANAQQATPVIGFLGGGNGLGANHFLDAFHAGLREMGYIEGNNVIIEYRFAQDRVERVPELVADRTNEIAHVNVRSLCLRSAQNRT